MPFSFFCDPPVLNAQVPAQAFGPSPTNPTTQYRFTSSHTATGNPRAVAVATGNVFLQIDPSNTSLCNIALRMSQGQPGGVFPDIAYFVYRGINLSSFVTSPTGPIQADPNLNLNTNILAAGRVGAAPTLAVLDGSAVAINNTTRLGTIFGNGIAGFRPFLVNQGDTLGNFNPGNIGFEIVLADSSYDLTVGGLQASVNQFTSSIAANPSANQAALANFQHWNEKEEVLKYMDPAAFFGNFASFTGDFLVNRNGGTPISYNGLGGNPAATQVFPQLVQPNFANASTIYLDLRDDKSRSLAYDNRYQAAPSSPTAKNASLPLQSGPNNGVVNLYGDGWPILRIQANTALDGGSGLSLIPGGLAGNTTNFSVSMPFLGTTTNPDPSGNTSPANMEGIVWPRNLPGGGNNLNYFQYGATASTNVQIGVPYDPTTGVGTSCYRRLHLIHPYYHPTPATHFGFGTLGAGVVTRRNFTGTPAIPSVGSQQILTSEPLDNLLGDHAVEYIRNFALATPAVGTTNVDAEPTFVDTSRNAEVAHIATRGMAFDSQNQVTFFALDQNAAGTRLIPPPAYLSPNTPPGLAGAFGNPPNRTFNASPPPAPVPATLAAFNFNPNRTFGLAGTFLNSLVGGAGAGYNSDPGITDTLNPNAAAEVLFDQNGGVAKLKGFDYLVFEQNNWGTIVNAVNSLLTGASTTLGTGTWIPNTPLYLGLRSPLPPDLSTSAIGAGFGNQVDFGFTSNQQDLMVRYEVVLRGYIDNGSGQAIATEQPLGAYTYKFWVDHTPDPNVVPGTFGYQARVDTSPPSGTPAGTQNIKITTTVLTCRSPFVQFDEYAFKTSYARENIRQVWNSNPNAPWAAISGNTPINQGMPQNFDNPIPQNGLAGLFTSGSPIDILPAVGSYLTANHANLFSSAPTITFPANFGNLFWQVMVERGYMYVIPNSGPVPPPVPLGRLTGKFHYESSLLGTSGFVPFGDIEEEDVNLNYPTQPRIDKFPTSPPWLAVITQSNLFAPGLSQAKLDVVWEAVKVAVFNYLQTTFENAQPVLFDTSEIQIRDATLRELANLGNLEVVALMDRVTPQGARSFFTASFSNRTVSFISTLNANPANLRAQLQRVPGRTGVFTLSENEIFQRAASVYYNNINDTYSNTTAHEFGHLLGLMDRYLYMGHVQRNSRPIVQTGLDFSDNYNVGAKTHEDRWVVLDPISDGNGFAQTIPMYLPNEFDPEYTHQMRWMHNLMSSQIMVLPDLQINQPNPFQGLTGDAGQLQRNQAQPIPNLGHESNEYVNQFLGNRPTNRQYYPVTIPPATTPTSMASFPPRYDNISVFITKVQMQLIIDRFSEYNLDGDLWGLGHLQNNNAIMPNIVFLREVDNRNSVTSGARPFFGTFLGLRREYEDADDDGNNIRVRKNYIVSDDRYFEFQYDNPSSPLGNDHQMQNRIRFRPTPTLPAQLGDTLVGHISNDPRGKFTCFFNFDSLVNPLPQPWWNNIPFLQLGGYDQAIANTLAQINAAITAAGGPVAAARTRILAFLAPVAITPPATGMAAEQLQNMPGPRPGVSISPVYRAPNHLGHRNWGYDSEPNARSIDNNHFLGLGAHDMAAHNHKWIDEDYDPANPDWARALDPNISLNNTRDVARRAGEMNVLMNWVANSDLVFFGEGDALTTIHRPHVSKDPNEKHRHNPNLELSIWDLYSYDPGFRYPTGPAYPQSTLGSLRQEFLVDGCLVSVYWENYYNRGPIINIVNVASTPNHPSTGLRSETTVLLNDWIWQSGIPATGPFPTPPGTAFRNWPF